jgi:hypothetical protein
MQLIHQTSSSMNFSLRAIFISDGISAYESIYRHPTLEGVWTIVGLHTYYLVMLLIYLMNAHIVSFCWALRGCAIHQALSWSFSLHVIFVWLYFCPWINYHTVRSEHLDNRRLLVSPVFFFADSSQFVVFELERKKNKENFKQNRYRVNFESSFSTGFTVS